jgi:hypothetical protein
MVELLDVLRCGLLVFRYVTSSTPALASFRRPSKATINAAGVSRCAIERNRVVLSALARSDNRLSAVDMVLDLGVSPCIPESGRPDVHPFPPVGSGRASSHLRRCWVSKTLRAPPDGLRLTARTPVTGRRGDLRVRRNPVSVPGQGPGGRREPRVAVLAMRPSVASTTSASAT